MILPRSTRRRKHRFGQRCSLCHRPLNKRDVLALNCGGDCMGCMLVIEHNSICHNGRDGLPRTLSDQILRRFALRLFARERHGWRRVTEVYDRQMAIGEQILQRRAKLYKMLDYDDMTDAQKEGERR